MIRKLLAAAVLVAAVPGLAWAALPAPTGAPARSGSDEAMVSAPGGWCRGQAGEDRARGAVGVRERVTFRVC